MVPLAGKDFPTSGGQLANALTGALTEVFALSKSGAAVSVDGDFPNLTRIAINLDNANVAINDVPPKPIGIGKRQPGFTVQNLLIRGRPIRHAQARFDLNISASGVTFDFDRDSGGRPLLVLSHATEGKVEAKISRTDIEALLLEAAVIAAKQQGASIKSLELNLTSDGLHAIAANVRVTAKKMMMTGIIHLAGRVEFDDQLNATLTALRCTGEGIVGGAVAGILQKKIAPLNGAKVPPAIFSLGGLKFRDLKITVTDSLQMIAAFRDG